MFTQVFVLLMAGTASGHPQQSSPTSSTAQEQSNSGSIVPEVAVQVDSGVVAENMYTSDFFGFSYLFPKGWSVQSEVTKKRLMEVGKAIITQGDPNKSAVMDVAEKHSYQLLTVFEHPVGTPVPFNPGLIVMAEDVSYAPGVKNGADYLLNLKMGLEKRHEELKILRAPTEQSFGGKSFFRMDVAFSTSTGATVLESYSSTVLKGNALTFIFFEERTERLQSLTDTLNTLEFKAGENLRTPLSRTSSTVESSQAEKAQTAVQILTPVDGVSFTEYLSGLLGMVKHKWYAIMPDDALAGKKGEVILQFSIDKNGALSGGPVMESSSGTGPFDEAALAALRVSAPFKSLPPDFKRPYIRLRFIFFYNIRPDSVAR
jgi:TonB family protein